MLKQFLREWWFGILLLISVVLMTWWGHNHTISRSTIDSEYVDGTCLINLRSLTEDQALDEMVWCLEQHYDIDYDTGLKEDGYQFNNTHHSSNNH